MIHKLSIDSNPRYCFMVVKLTVVSGRRCRFWISATTAWAFPGCDILWWCRLVFHWSETCQSTGGYRPKSRNVSQNSNLEEWCQWCQSFRCSHIYQHAFTKSDPICYCFWLGFWKPQTIPRFRETFQSLGGIPTIKKKDPPTDGPKPQFCGEQMVEMVFLKLHWRLKVDFGVQTLCDACCFVMFYLQLERPPGWSKCGYPH